MKHLQLLIKPASSNCNMKCDYCLYMDECKNRETYSYGFMNMNTLECLVKKALEEAEKSCVFGFQGDSNPRHGEDLEGSGTAISWNNH